MRQVVDCRAGIDIDRSGRQSRLGLVEGVDRYRAIMATQAEVAHRFLPAEVGETAYRIVQEAINNAVKHSGASHLLIRVKVEAKAVRLDIIDDGMGLPSDYQEKSKGMGLLNMNYRAHLIGATIAIESSEGKGTQVSLVLPLTGNHNAA